MSVTNLVSHAGGEYVGRARRVAVVFDEPLIGDARYDYADAFEIRLPSSDRRTPEQFARGALERGPFPVRQVVWTVHRHLLRFRLGPRRSPGHVFGWTILTSTPDVLELEAVSPLLRAVIVGRKPDPTRWLIATYAFYLRPIPARAMWRVVGPLHRRVAPYLLEHAAKSNVIPSPAVRP